MTTMTAPPKHIIHDWIREDLPISIKMVMMPEHVEKLLGRIASYHAISAYVDQVAADVDERQCK